VRFSSTQGRSIVSVLFLACAFAAFPAANAGEAEARKLAERAFTGKHVEALRKLPGLPFYEIWIGRTLVYTDLDAKVLIVGNLLDGATLGNLREARLAELSAVPIAQIPLDGALKTVRGKGRNQLVVFADPNCGFCKRYEGELKALTDATIYTVVYPVLGPDSLVKARAILCAPEPEKAWHAWMAERVMPPTPADSCRPAFDSIVAFGKKNEIGITPTTFLANGKRLAGVIPGATLKVEIASARR
jgi:thiol:disulfide interchange protein DsbC